MRTFCAAVLAVALVSSSALAASEISMEPGKPAGVEQAQNSGDGTLYLLGGGAVLVTLGLVLTGGGDSGGGRNPNTSVTTTNTTK